MFPRRRFVRKTVGFVRRLFSGRGSRFAVRRPRFPRRYSRFSRRR